MHRSTAPDEDARTILINRVSWGAVLAGVALALAVQLLLNMLGLGLGIATIDPGTADSPTAGTFSIAAGIWFVVSGIIAAFAGGSIAGRLSGQPLGSTAALHGLTSWAVTTLVVIYLLTTAVGGIIGGVFSGVTGAMGGLGRTASSVAQAAAPGLAQATDPFGAIEQQLRNVSGGNDAAALRDTAVAAVRAALTGDQAQAEEARGRAAEALAKAQNIPVEDARKRVAEYEQQYRETLAEARKQAVQAADTAAKVVSRGALFGFVALVLGAVAAWFGGRSGAVVPTITNAGLSPSARRRP